MTTYCNLDPANRRLEIGSTWLGKEAQRTGLNTATKLLLLTRAFEELGCLAVEFRAHWHNHQSRRAIEGLGAKQDGVLRKPHCVRERHDPRHRGVPPSPTTSAHREVRTPRAPCRQRVSIADPLPDAQHPSIWVCHGFESESRIRARERLPWRE